MVVFVKKLLLFMSDLSTMGVSVLFLLLVLCCQTTAVVTVGHNAVHTILVSSVPSGIEVSLASNLPNGGQTTTSFILSSHFASECGNNNNWRCNVEIVRTGDSTWFMFLSVAGAVSVTKLILLGSALTNIETYDIRWPEAGGLPCQPTAVFYYKSLPFVACLNQTNMLWFVSVRVNINNLASSKLDTDPGNSVTFEPSVLTRFIRDVSPRCPGATDPVDHVVFASGHTIYDYSYEASTTTAEIEALSENCSQAEDLAYYGGSTVLVQCPNQVWERTDICNSVPVETYSASTTGVPVPCSTWDYVVYLVENSILVPAFQGTANGSIPLPYNTTDYPECVMAENGVFLVLQFNSTVVAIDVLSNTSYLITNNSCTSDGQCFKPQVWRKRFLGFINGTHFLLKDLNCLMNAPIHEIELSSFPMVTHVIGGTDFPVDQCDTVSTLSSSTSALDSTDASSTPTTSATAGDASTMSRALSAANPSSTPLPSDKPPDVNTPPGNQQSSSDSSATTAILYVLVAVSLLLLILAITIIISIVGCRKYKMKMDSRPASQLELKEQRNSSEDESDSQCPISEGTYHHPDDEQPHLKQGTTISPFPEASDLVPVDEDRTVPDNGSQPLCEGSNSYHHVVDSDDEQPRRKPLEDDQHGATISPFPEAFDLVVPVDEDGTVPDNNGSQPPREDSSSYNRLIESDDEQPRLKPLEEYGATISPAPATDSTSTASQLVVPVQVDRDRSVNEPFNQSSTVFGLQLPVPYDNLHPEQYIDDSEENRNRHLTIAIQYYPHL